MAVRRRIEGRLLKMADRWSVSGVVGQVKNCVADAVAGYGENEEWQTGDVMALTMELHRG